MNTVGIYSPVSNSLILLFTSDAIALALHAINVYGACMQFLSQILGLIYPKLLFLLLKVAHPTGFEPVTSAFGGLRAMVKVFVEGRYSRRLKKLMKSK